MNTNQFINSSSAVPRVLAISSGKGGVGKTNVSVNVGIALAQSGQRVTLLDADLGLANIDVLFGIHPIRNLSHVLQGECSIKDILITGPGNINIVPAASGIRMMSRLSSQEHAALIHAFDELATVTDTLLVDTSAGIADSVLSFCSAAQEVVVVVCNEPASVTDAYALIKVLSLDYGISNFRVLVNMADSVQEGNELFRRLLNASDKYLDVTLSLLGIVPRDSELVRSVQKQRPVILNRPQSAASVSFREIAKSILKLPKRGSANGRLEFFLEKILQSRSSAKEVSNYD